MFATLHECYCFPMMRQCIQMYLKYCGPCQMFSTKKLDKCPHEMQPVKVPKEAWSQIGKIFKYISHAPLSFPVRHVAKFPENAI